MASRTLKIAAGSLAVVGTVSVLVALLLSAQPDAKPPAKKPSVNVEHLMPGQAITFDTESLRYFVVRPPVGEVHVVAVPTQEGTVLMPEIYWWKPFMNCKDFGLDEVDGAITADSRFRCRDANQPAAWVKQWQWDLRGQHLTNNGDKKIDNMYRVSFERSGNEVIFTGLEPD